ncbi:MAG: cadmium-translocating P-type ATPase [Sphingomonadales bacterium]|nr:MAG: cadmium-translocating P-type ATPase [Sphingomonadales bacterium]
MTTLELVVPGMHCAGCLSKVERALRTAPGVLAARANLSTRRVRIDSEAELSEESCLSALAAVGFDARPYRNAHTGDLTAQEGKRLVQALGVAGFAMMNVMLFSIAIWSGSDMDAATRALFHWLSALVAIPAIAYAGQPFFRSAWRALRRRSTNMDVPISVGVLLTTGASLFQTVRGGHYAYFDAAVMLLFFLLVGRVFDHRLRARAFSAAQALLKAQALKAQVIRADGGREWLAIDAVTPGMALALAAGESLGVDARVLSGVSDVDTALVTGESAPQAVAPGDELSSGVVNLSAPLVVEALRPASLSLLAELARLMEQAEQGRAGLVRLADRVARLYTPVVHLGAALTFAGWMLAGQPWHPALMAAVAVLIITCPCALGLAVPAAQVAAVGRLMRRGVIVKSGDALERLAAVDTVVFDKTGTLTTGALTLVSQPCPEVHALAAALAVHSRHPLSRALAGSAPEHLPAATAILEVPGCGVEGDIGGRRYRLGRPDWVGAPMPDHPGPALAFGGDDQPPRLFLFQDRPRPDAREAVRVLQSRGYAVALLSGDRPEAVAAAAAEAGIEQVHAGATPLDKQARLAQLERDGHRVLMVGDGLNDAAALRTAHVAMSPGSATDLAQTAADIVFQDGALMSVVEVLETAGRTARIVRQNFALAIGYNVLAVPLAIAGQVTPLIAALAMSLSSILVTANALRLGLRR